MPDTMTVAELKVYQETGKLPKRHQKKTRMEVIADVAAQDPVLAEQAAEVVAKRNKYGAIKTEVDGITFDSKKEAARYLELKAFESLGLIANLELQPQYVFELNGVRITSYKPDFRYHTPEGDTVVEDVKGGRATQTRDYRIRKKMMKAFYGIEVREV